MKKAGVKDTLRLYKDNFVMITSLEVSDEQVCADKCLQMLEKHVEQNCEPVKEGSD